jgi:hypothetical protein
MIGPKDQCEACRIRPVEFIVEDDDPRQPYRLCGPCAYRLRTLSLRPLEWFNLAAIHSPWKFLLHDDFYSEEGMATQPREAVEHPHRYPAPTLELVKDDLERLLDYAMAQWWLKDDVLQALALHDKKQLLSALQGRIERCPNYEVESKAYAICATVLGPLAGDWIRERWRTYDFRTLLTLAQATARCLPLDEGYPKVIQALMDVAPQELVDKCFALGWFRSEKTLDWLESHTSYMVNNWGHISERWGQLAALSQFSWPRAVRWLDCGRPLSLVAILALKAVQRNNVGLQLEPAPVLIDPAPVDAMVSRLREYAARDAVPRVEQDVQAIIDTLI